MKTFVASAIILGASLAQAATNHIVTLGAGGELQFNPNQITATPGDTVTFQFLAGVCPHLTQNICTHILILRITPLHNPHSPLLVCLSTVYGLDSSQFQQHPQLPQQLVPKPQLPQAVDLAPATVQATKRNVNLEKPLNTQLQSTILLPHGSTAHKLNIVKPVWFSPSTSMQLYFPSFLLHELPLMV